MYLSAWAENPDTHSTYTHKHTNIHPYIYPPTHVSRDTIVVSKRQAARHWCHLTDWSDISELIDTCGKRCIGCVVSENVHIDMSLCVKRPLKVLPYWACVGPGGCACVQALKSIHAGVHSTWQEAAPGYTTVTQNSEYTQEAQIQTHTVYMWTHTVGGTLRKRSNSIPWDRRGGCKAPYLPAPI